jgi:hypothetical protein
MIADADMTAIYNPANPPLIYDGLLDVYSTCRDCGEKMKVITPQQHSHPPCATVQTQLESMADLLAAELGREDWAQAELTEQMMNDVRVLDLGSAAYEYAKWGWHVFPLARHAKAPAIPKRKGGKGYKDATNDAARIEKWWARHPDHNVGLATGHGFDVIDVDTKDSDGNPSPQGIISFMDLLEAHKIPECHGVAVTASGGTHLYVKATGKGCFAGIRPGIDYRGLGGYVVAPPSHLGKPGRGYTWLVEPSPIIKGGNNNG